MLLMRTGSPLTVPEIDTKITPPGSPGYSKKTPIALYRHDNIQNDILKKAVLNYIQGDIDILNKTDSESHIYQITTGGHDKEDKSARSGHSKSFMKRISPMHKHWSRDSSQHSFDSGISSLTSASSTQSVIQIGHSSSIKDWSHEKLDEVKYQLEINDGAITERDDEEDSPMRPAPPRAALFPTAMGRQDTMDTQASKWKIAAPIFVTSFRGERKRRHSSESPVRLEQSSIINGFRAGRFSRIASFFRRRDHQIVPDDHSCKPSNNQDDKTLKRSQTAYVHRYSM